MLCDCGADDCESCHPGRAKRDRWDEAIEDEADQLKISWTEELDSLWEFHDWSKYYDRGYSPKDAVLAWLKEVTDA